MLVRTSEIPQLDGAIKGPGSNPVIFSAIDYLVSGTKSPGVVLLTNG